MQRVDSGCATTHASMVQSSSLIPEPTVYSSFFSDLSGCQSETKARQPDTKVCSKIKFMQTQILVLNSLLWHFLQASKPASQTHTRRQSHVHQDSHYKQAQNFQADSEESSCAPTTEKIIDETLRLCEPCRRFFSKHLDKIAPAGNKSDPQKKLDDEFRAAWTFANRRSISRNEARPSRKRARPTEQEYLDDDVRGGAQQVEIK